ncbi:MAG: c-type cytochrome [Thiohalomonadaceae bacterium]
MNRLVIAALLLGALGSAQAAGSASAGQAKAAICSACHMMDGNSAVPMWPVLAGQHEQYIHKQVMDFKAELRKDETMAPMVAALTEEDVADLAAWFSSQTRNIGTVADAEKAAAGEKLYRAGDAAKGLAACMACHGPDGAGNPAANFPSLASQHSTYTIKALKDFRDGIRTNDQTNMMRAVAAKMTDAQIEQVAEYIAGLH